MAAHGHIGSPCSICGFPLEGEDAKNFIYNNTTNSFLNTLKTFKRTRTSHLKPITVKGYIKMALTIANTPIADLKGVEKLSTEEQRVLSDLSVVLQNELGENDTLLEKFKLKY